mgnify:CR=1 FL=1
MKSGYPAEERTRPGSNVENLEGTAFSNWVNVSVKDWVELREHNGSEATILNDIATNVIEHL